MANGLGVPRPINPFDLECPSALRNREGGRQAEAVLNERHRFEQNVVVGENALAGIQEDLEPLFGELVARICPVGHRVDGRSVQEDHRRRFFAKASASASSWRSETGGRRPCFERPAPMILEAPAGELDLPLSRRLVHPAARSVFSRTGLRDDEALLDDCSGRDGRNVPAPGGQVDVGGDDGETERGVGGRPRPSGRDRFGGVQARDEEKAAQHRPPDVLHGLALRERGDEAITVAGRR
jgi:hypothetical protein